MSGVEEKVDALGRTLEQLLSRRECAQCGACPQHARQQEEQARRLEAVEQLVLAMHAVLQGPCGGVADRRWPAAGPRKDMSCRMPSALGVPLGTPAGEGKEALFSLVRSRTQALTQRDAQSPLKKGSRVITQPMQRSETADKVDEKLQEPLSSGVQEQDESKCPPAVLLTTMSPPRIEPLKPEEAPRRTGNTRSGKRRKSLTQTKSGSRDGKESENKQTDGEGVQVSVIPDKKPETTERSTSGGALTGLEANGAPHPPNAPAAWASEPQELPELTVPEVMNEVSTLRHVSSCPVSLQRLQGSEMPSSQVAPPLACTGNTAVGATAPKRKLSVASSIQIQISPALTDLSRPKSPPQTCCKVIDDDPPLPAPFPHRLVSVRPSRSCDAFNINAQAVLGGGRFGRVHRCTEKTSGLKLAAKIITARNAKEKEVALNEIQVMNQLSHANILQLYDAYEARNEVVLILEYVDGGELFERIVDESSPLTELDAIIFVKQICQGIQYMHQMYVLHLDLKPENILCVNCTGHQVKIIDFGLARRYKPREKLRVSFGTPEFLAPEIVNFDFVSFPTDMWTVGVVTYMMLSGLSPFLGDDDSQTLNNVLTGNWYLEEEAFEHVSDEAKDFISNLLIREKSGRLSAAQCLKHSWLNNISEKAKRCNIVLKSQVQLKKYMARRLWKKNYIAIAAANRFKKISRSGSVTSLGT